jgi:hypothetical protein
MRLAARDTPNSAALVVLDHPFFLLRNAPCTAGALFTHSDGPSLQSMKLTNSPLSSL